MRSLSFLLLLLLCLHGSSARLHSLMYFYSASSEVPNFPEFMIDGLVDDVQVIHYDSDSRRAEFRQDWMNRVTADDPQYLARYTEIYLAHELWFRGSLGRFKKLLKLTEGVHTAQVMYGCEWDNKTGHVESGFNKVSFDGGDFLTFDLKTETWIAAKPEAVPLKRVLDKDSALKSVIKDFFTEQCPYYVKKFVDCGKSSLLRTELPSVSLLQKTSSSPVRCLATGFYPDRAMIFWRRDGVEIHEDVEHGEILPNQDGTFQMSVDLDVSSVTAEDWGRWDCVFQLSGVKEDMVTRLDRAGIRTNEVNPSHTGIIIGAVIIIFVLAIAVVGYLVYRKKNDKRPPSPVRNREIEMELPLNQTT